MPNTITRADNVGGIVMHGECAPFGTNLVRKNEQNIMFSSVHVFFVFFSVIVYRPNWIFLYHVKFWSLSPDVSQLRQSRGTQRELIPTRLPSVYNGHVFCVTMLPAVRPTPFQQVYVILNVHSI